MRGSPAEFMNLSERLEGHLVSRIRTYDRNNARIATLETEKELQRQKIATLEEQFNAA
jgi:hypothetical protein